MKPKAAFFDLDNTLIDGSSIYYFVKGLVKNGEITKRNIARFALDQYRFQKKKTDNFWKIIH